jgi:hypothetical protein
MVGRDAVETAKAIRVRWQRAYRIGFELQIPSAQQTSGSGKVGKQAHLPPEEKLLLDRAEAALK